MSIQIETHLRAHPEDRGSWLVYADWLRKEGDPRGELLSGALRGAAGAEDRIKKQQSKWKKGLPEGSEVQWRHGFVTGLQLVWGEEAAALLGGFLGGRDARFLTELRLDAPERDGELEDQDFEAEPPVQDEVEPQGLSAEEHEARLAAMAQLAALDLSTLRSLSLPYWELGSAGARALAASPHLRTLTALDLRYCALGNAGVSALAAALDGGSIEELHLQRNRLTEKGAQALAGVRLPALRVLDLRYNGLGDAGAQALGTAPFADGLRSLRLNRADVGKEGSAALAQASALPVAVRRLWSGQ